MTCRATQPGPARPRHAFTLIEVLVSVGLLAITIAALSTIFTISSDATARAAANAEVMRASSAVRDRIDDQVSKIADEGLLIINCPAPTTPRAEAPVGSAPRGFRQRWDSLVFLARGGVEEYVSHTDPYRGDPANPTARPASSSEAIVYFGPGTPLTRTAAPPVPRPLANDANVLGATMTAQEWMFLHRTILLLAERDPNNTTAWNPPTVAAVTSPGAMLGGGPLDANMRRGQMDAIVSAPNMPASVQTLAEFVLGLPLAGDLLTAAPSIASLWEPSWAPATVTTDNDTNPDFYTRGGATFVPGLADFRIDWTDGKQNDPANGDLRIRWFGLRPDPDFDVSNNVLDSFNNPSVTPQIIPSIAVRREDTSIATTVEEAKAFGITSIAPGSQNQIEWTNIPGGSGDDAAYRAIWRGDTWKFRPRALRFTYRIYDANHRLKHTSEVDLDEDGNFDPDETGADDERRVGVRYGREFSIVVPLR